MDVVAALRWELWTAADVSRWVATVLELPQYADAFRQHEVDGPTLLELTEETLKDPLRVDDSLKRKKILGHINVLKIRGITEEEVPQPGRWTPPPSRARKQAPRPASSEPRTPPRSAGAGAAAAAAATAAAAARGNLSALRARRQRTGTSASSTRTPRSASTSSARSADGSVGVSTRSLGEEGSLYSDYMNSNPKITAGLTSNFGLDSPSYSRLGSFSHSSSKLVFPGTSSATNVPGPASYDVHGEVADKVRRSSPRAVMGRSPRNTTEFMIHNAFVPGVGKYQTSRNGSKGGNAFSSTPRFKYSRQQTPTWLTARGGPGPADYHPIRNYDSTFRL